MSITINQPRGWLRQPADMLSQIKVTAGVPCEASSVGTQAP